jgi:RNA polymerase sigma-70 factor (ECF subfamily)
MPEPPVQELVEHLFRHRAGQMLATLTRIFGPRHLDLAEDVVQEALMQALRQWPFRGVPDNPSAWLVQVAKNRALDRLRREESLREKEAELRRWAATTAPLVELDEGFADDQLRMMFMCCHDALSCDARVALTLKTIGGFDVAEIARAFLAPEGTIAQRLVRAKRKLQEDDQPLAMPTTKELPARLDSVMEVLYLMFNEGYAAHQGEELIRRDLVQESLRLAALLLRHPPTALPKVHALAALMLFQASRLSARLDEDGNLLLLQDQDRSLWDRGMIQMAFGHLREAGRGNELSEFHLQAGIASCHAMASSWDATDWRQIVRYYDLLWAVCPSPIVALNRAVAVAQIEGAEAGLRLIAPLEADQSLPGYYLLAATRGELLRRLGRCDEARSSFESALDRVTSEPVRRYLLKKLRSLDELA